MGRILIVARQVDPFPSFELARLDFHIQGPADFRVGGHEHDDAAVDQGEQRHQVADGPDGPPVEEHAMADDADFLEFLRGSRGRSWRWRRRRSRGRSGCCGGHGASRLGCSNGFQGTWADLPTPAVPVPDNSFDARRSWRTLRTKLVSGNSLVK